MSAIVDMKIWGVVAGKDAEGFGEITRAIVLDANGEELAVFYPTHPEARNVNSQMQFHLTNDDSVGMRSVTVKLQTRYENPKTHNKSEW